MGGWAGRSFLGAVRDERHLQCFGRHFLTPNVDLDLRAGPGAVGGEIGRPDRGVYGWRDSAAAHDVQMCPVEKHRKAWPRDRLRLGHLESHEPPLHALELLTLQRLEPREWRAFLELHDERQ